MTEHNTNRSILAGLAISLTIVALIANHAVGRIETGVLKAVPVARFPQRIDSWQMVSEEPMSAEVKKAVPTAVIADRLYQHTMTRRQANLVLLTATDYADFHDPNICMPGNGFEIVRSSETTMGGQPGKMMVTAQNGHRYTVFYWWIGGAAIDTGFGREQWGRVLAFRDRLQGTENRSLFVRLTVTGDDQVALNTLTDLLTAAKPAIDQITRETETTAIASEPTRKKATTL